MESITLIEGFLNGIAVIRGFFPNKGNPQIASRDCPLQVLG
jgi:hypothetical protein